MAFVFRGAGGQVYRWLTYLRRHVVTVGVVARSLIWRHRRVRWGHGPDGVAATGTLVAVSIVFLVGAAVELVAVLEGISPHSLHQTILVLDVVLATGAAVASRWLGRDDGSDR